MRRSPIRRTPPFWRIWAVFLCLSLFWVPGTGFSRLVPGTGLNDALRPQPDLSGLEEKLSTGLEEGVDWEEVLDTADRFYKFPEIFRRHFANKTGVITPQEWGEFVSDVREKDPVSADLFAKLPFEEIQRPHGNLLRHKPTGKGFLVTAGSEGSGKSLYSAILAGSAQIKWTRLDPQSEWEYRVDDNPVVLRVRDRVIAGLLPHWKPGWLTTRYPLGAKGSSNRKDSGVQYATRIPEKSGFLALAGAISLDVGESGDLDRVGNHWNPDARGSSSDPDLIFGKVAQEDSIPRWSGRFVGRVRQLPLFGVHVEGDRTPQTFQPTVARLNEWASRTAVSLDAADHDQRMMERVRLILSGRDPLANFVRPAERLRLRSSWGHYVGHRISLSWTGIRPAKFFSPAVVRNLLLPIEQRHQDYEQGRITWENLPLLSVVLVQLSRFPGRRVPIYAALITEDFLRQFASDPRIWDAARREIPPDHREWVKKIFLARLSARAKRDNGLETALFSLGVKVPSTRPVGPEGNLKGKQISDETLHQALEDIVTAVRNLPPVVRERLTAWSGALPKPADRSTAAARERSVQEFHQKSLGLIDAWIKAAGLDQPIGNGTQVWIQDNLGGSALQNNSGVTLRQLRDRVAQESSRGITGAWLPNNTRKPARIWVRDLKQGDRWVVPSEVSRSMDGLERVGRSKPFFSAVVEKALPGTTVSDLQRMNRPDLLVLFKSRSEKVADKMWGIWESGTVLDGRNGLPKVIGYREDLGAAASLAGPGSPTLDKLVNQVNETGAGLSVEKFDPASGSIRIRVIYPGLSNPTWPYTADLIRYLERMEPFLRHLDGWAEQQATGQEEKLKPVRSALVEERNSLAAGLEEGGARQLTPVGMRRKWKIWWQTKGKWGLLKQAIASLDSKEQSEYRDRVYELLNYLMPRGMPADFLLEQGIDLTRKTGWTQGSGPDAQYFRESFSALEKFLLELDEQVYPRWSRISQTLFSGWALWAIDFSRHGIPYRVRVEERGGETLWVNLVVPSGPIDLAAGLEEGVSRKRLKGEDAALSDDGRGALDAGSFDPDSPAPRTPQSEARWPGNQTRYLPLDSSAERLLPDEGSYHQSAQSDGSGIRQKLDQRVPLFVGNPHLSSVYQEVAGSRAESAAGPATGHWRAGLEEDEWGLFGWENGEEPNWLEGESVWDSPERLNSGTLKELEPWFKEAIPGWKEEGVSRIKLVFPPEDIFLARDFDLQQEGTPWIVERILVEIGGIEKGLSVPYEVIRVRDLVTIQPAAGPATGRGRAGLEEGRGYVAVGPVGLMVPADFPVARYYVVAVGIEQAAALIQAGRDPLRIIAVATGLEEVAGLAALGVPGDQIVRAWDWPTLEAAKNYAVRLGKDWLAGLQGLRVSVLEVTAKNLQEILAQLQEMLPSAWQAARPITAEDAHRTLDWAAVSV